MSLSINSTRPGQRARCGPVVPPQIDHGDARDGCYRGIMRKQELVALRLKTGTYQGIIDVLPSTFDTLGIAVDAGARDGSFTIRDHGERGCVVILGNSELAQRAARALAPKVGGPVQVFAVS